jgi:uncharacterized membrane protein YhaH (DUF805 family)
MTTNQALSILEIKEPFSYQTLDRAFGFKRDECNKGKQEAINEEVKNAYAAVLQEVLTAYQVLIPLTSETGETFEQPQRSQQKTTFKSNASTSRNTTESQGNMFDLYLKALKKYTIFSGRATVKEYWSFVLFNILFAILAILIDIGIGLSEVFDNFTVGIIYLLYVLFSLLPSIAAAIRRLHDVGKSGWMLLVSLIPLVGGIWLLVLMVTEGNNGDNKYGPDPKQIK